MESLADLVHARARAYRALVALRVQGRDITYGELDERARALASALLAAGADRDTVGIVGQRKAGSYIGILGIIYAGCHYTPINPKYSEARIVSMLRDAGIRCLVGDRSDIEALEPILQSPEAPRIEAIFLPEGECPAGKSWRGERELGGQRVISAPRSSNSEDLAYLLYTSGSTGKPKGVQVANANILAFLRSMGDVYKLAPGFRASQTFDFSFDPSVSDLFFTWTNGGTLCVLPEEEMLLPHEYIRREGITFWNSVPAIAAFLGRMGHLNPGAFPGLEHSMFCGEQFPQHVADAWRVAAPNSSIENLYGPTEATIYISRHVYTQAEKTRSFRHAIIPIGRSFLNHEFALVDDSGQRLRDGETGEIVFKGPQITRGYLHDPERTAAVFVTFSWDESGAVWYRSGDLGFYNEDGNLECIGRRDSQIKLGGRRIEIGEIEAALRKYAELQDIVVVPLRDDNDVVTGCAGFVTQSLARSDEMRIRQDSVRHLEKIFFPRKIFVVDSLPLAPSGKVDRKALADRAKELFLPAAPKLQ